MNCLDESGAGGVLTYEDHMRKLEDAVRKAVLAEREACRAACIEVNMDARKAATKSDVSHYDSESYAAGYMDAAIDCDEAIRERSNS